MKPKSISGIGCYVQDLDKTIEFYESLGFRAGKRTENAAVFYVNWFWLEFVSAPQETKEEFKSEAQAERKGAGIYINVNVDDVDEFYQSVVDAGLSPSSEPRDWPYGRREFVLRDPDGYKLVFFEKSK